MHKMLVLFLSLVIGFTFISTDGLTVKAHHNDGTFPYYQNSDGTTKFIALYNPDGGGFLASIALTVEGSISYRDSAIPNYHDVVIYAETRTHKNSFVQCGGTITTRDYVVFGGSNISLVTGGSYFRDPNYVYDTRHSDIIGAGPTPYSFSVESEGSFYPNPSTCYGGGTVTDKWTFSN